MKKLWKQLNDRPLLKAFLHYYQASDSELTSVAVAYYWLIAPQLICQVLCCCCLLLDDFSLPINLGQCRFFLDNLL